MCCVILNNNCNYFEKFLFIGKIIKYEGGVVSKIFINIEEWEVIAEYKIDLQKL